jgi:hypothetical protein
MNNQQDFIETVKEEFHQWYFKGSDWCSPDSMTATHIKNNSDNYKTMLEAYIAKAQKDRDQVEMFKSAFMVVDDKWQECLTKLSQKDEEIEIHVSLNKKVVSEYQDKIQQLKEELRRERETLDYVQNCQIDDRVWNRIEEVQAQRKEV